MTQQATQQPQKEKPVWKVQIGGESILVDSRGLQGIIRPTTRAIGPFDILPFTPQNRPEGKGLQKKKPKAKKIANRHNGGVYGG